MPPGDLIIASCSYRANSACRGCGECDNGETRTSEIDPSLRGILAANAAMTLSLYSLSHIFLQCVSLLDAAFLRSERGPPKTSGCLLQIARIEQQLIPPDCSISRKRRRSASASNFCSTMLFVLLHPPPTLTCECVFVVRRVKMACFHSQFEEYYEDSITLRRRGCGVAIVIGYYRQRSVTNHDWIIFLYRRRNGVTKKDN
jgi:hypothetical protein